MKIRVSSADGHKIKLAVPLNIIKSRFIAKKIEENSGNAFSRKELKLIYNELKKWKGLNLVEVHSSDGDEVLIKI